MARPFALNIGLPTRPLSALILPDDTETTGRKERVRWVLSWMPDVKVLAPKSLRDRITEKLQAGLRAQE